ncbi:MAG: CrcB family protein [Actinomycetota bacterium]
MTVGDVAIVLAVIVAAGVGAVLRFLLAERLNQDFPIGTLAANLAASAALGVAVSAPDVVATVLGIGALGSLSTWSTAANEAAAFSREDHGSLGIGYLALTVSSGILAAWIGLRLGIAIYT